MVYAHVPPGSRERMTSHQMLAAVLEQPLDARAGSGAPPGRGQEATAVFGTDDEATALALHELGRTLSKVDKDAGIQQLRRAVATMQSALPGKALREHPVYAQMQADLQAAQAAAPDPGAPQDDANQNKRPLGGGL